MTKQLSAQQLACGCTQNFDIRSIDNIYPTHMQLFEQHGAYFVRIHNHDKHLRVIWRAFDTLTAARQYYNKCKARFKRVSYAKTIEY